MTTDRNRRIVIWAMSLSLLLGLAGSTGFIPSVEAASSSASARIIKTLKKQLAAARALPPTPTPFIEMVRVGNVGNVADFTTYGAVLYEYSIGEYEVTLAQYTAFLTAVAATDPHARFFENSESRVKDGRTAGVVGEMR